jgi:DNA-binding FadR family transcriptional regulator
MKHSGGKGPGKRTGGTLRNVRSPKLAHLVAEQLRADIASGKIGSGDTLPSEAELLNQFGISRPTLREALRVLESETLIQLRRGSRTGARVLGPSVKAIAQRSALYLAVGATTLGELHQVRSLLEPSIAGLLARRSKRDFVRALEQSVERQAAALAAADFDAVLEHINEYHDLLIGLSENKVYILFAGILQEISRRLQPQILLVADRRGQRAAFTKSCATAVNVYRELTRLIAAGKSAEVEKKWRSHMDRVARYLDESGMAKVRVGVLS